MAHGRKRPINLRAPYLKRVWLDPDRIREPERLSLRTALPARRLRTPFDQAITIIVGENGTGKSTLLEGDCGPLRLRPGRRRERLPARRSLRARSRRAAHRSARALRAAWLPKLSNGWFFRAESFFSVARYLDEVAQEPFGGPPPDFLSHSHGEGFLRFFEERCHRQGLFIFDEPEAALSPSRQIEFLKLLRRIEQSGIVQVIMATHAPMLMAYPGARLLQLTRAGWRRCRWRKPTTSA